MHKKMTIEQLAIMIQNTMASKEDLKLLATKKDLYALDQKVGTLEQKVGTLEQKVDILEQKVDAGFQHVYARLDAICEDISDLPAMREELYDHGRRVERLEQKAGHAQ